jgi:hypothetical protein
MTGHYEGNRVTLTPAYWLQRPLGYNMVGLEGEVRGGTLKGSVIGAPGCATFSVTKVAPAVSQLERTVAVVASGFSQEKNGSGTYIYYGVELKNDSLKMDALGVVVTRQWRRFHVPRRGWARRALSS